MNTEHSIFKAVVRVESQEDCNIAREICERYNLPVWKDVDLAFDYVDYEDDDYTYLKHLKDNDDKDRIGFYIDNIDEEDQDLNIMSIEQFEALADDYNPQFKSVEDALAKLKELNNILNNK
jgi:hypothetical protein